MAPVASDRYGLAESAESSPGVVFLQGWRATSSALLEVQVRKKAVESAQPHGQLTDFFEDSDERRAARQPVAESTLAHRDVATGEWTIHGGLPALLAWGMAAESGSVWLTPVDPDEESDEVVLRFDGDTWTYHDIGTLVVDMAVAPDGTIWVATHSGELRELKRSAAG